jgi:hypothetical protein
MRVLLPLIMAACSAKAATPPTVTPPAPAVTTPPKPAGSPFGRYTVVAPEGYTVEARDIEIGFRRDDILIVALDGAELGTPPPDKCEGQLAAFARTATQINVASSKRLANGCRLVGTTAATPSALVEAAVLDLGIEGPALAFLIHTRPDDGASTTFDEVLTSIAKK